MEPLVSILIPAYNAQAWIADTIRSALAQTWSRKEIIIADDGSRDKTMAVAQEFSSKTVAVVSQPNQGAASARNKAFSLCQGDYIQWLDADDLLSPDKVAMQMDVAQRSQDKRLLLSSGWGKFAYRTSRADFSPTSLWCDLSPLEWLLTKMSQNLHMQPATWLVSRELTQAAGPWDVRLSLDDDGEYFCRVLLASGGTRFVTEGKTYYRTSGFSSLSMVDGSQKKLQSQLLSMQLHVKYLRSLEESERVRATCLTYLKTWFPYFYPESPELVGQIQDLAGTLGARLDPPRLSWKYAWIKTVFGWTAAKRSQLFYNRCKSAVLRRWDRVGLRLQGRLTAGPDLA